MTILAPSAAYDAAAPFYDGWSWQAFWRRHEAPIVLEMLDRFRRGRGRTIDLLDVGCGTGWYLAHTAELCREQAGIDVSGGMLAVARGRCPRVLLRRGDARSLPFRSGRYDAVICTRVLSHLPHPGPAIAEMRRVLAPSGLLVLSDVDATHDYESTRLPVAGGHVMADTYKHPRPAMFEEVAAAGFAPLSERLIRFGQGDQPQLSRGADRGGAVVGWVACWRRTADALDAVVEVRGRVKLRRP